MPNLAIGCTLQNENARQPPYGSEEKAMPSRWQNRQPKSAHHWHAYRKRDEMPRATPAAEQL